MRIKKKRMTIRLFILSFILIFWSQSSMAQTVSHMIDYARLVEAGGPFPKQIDLKKTTKFYLTNDYLISVSSNVNYEDKRIVTLQLEEEKEIARFKIDQEDIKKSHPLSNPANQAFGPFTFSLSNPHELTIDCTKFNIQNYLITQQSANIVGLSITYNGLLEAHFDNNTSTSFYQITISDGQKEKQLEIESDKINHPIEWDSYVVKFNHAGKGLFCTVQPKGMNSFPINLPLHIGHVNPALTIDSTTFKVSSYFKYENPENKEENVYGANLKIIQEGYTPNDFIQFTDSQPQVAALAFGGYFWWLKQEEDVLLIERPKYDVPFSVSQTKQTFKFDDEYTLTYEGAIVFRYEFSEEVTYSFQLTHGKETEIIEFSTYKDSDTVQRWKNIEVELVKMEGMKRVRILVRRIK